MFASLFFLFLVLALINFVPEIETTFLVDSLFEAFGLGLLLYIALLIIIVIQIGLFAKWRRFNISFYVILTNVELLFFFCFYHFALGAHRWLCQGPHLCLFHFPNAVFSVMLYLMGLGWMYFWLGYFRAAHTTTTPLRHASLQILFLFPFCFPFLVFSVLFDLMNSLPSVSAWLAPSDSWIQTIGLSMLSLIMIIVTMLLMPPLIVTCWRCRPLRHPFLLPRLEALCQRMHFKHAGIKMWTIMRHQFTAGIIGLVPRFRYIMFTDNLIQQFPLQEIEAILIHEIGHSRYKHLWIYPFVLLGMLVTATWLSLIYTEPLEHYFHVQFERDPSAIWNFLFLVSLFSLYAFILGLYFRFVFGFFSRLFERQADLNIFDSSLPPIYMIHALDHIAIVTGYSHRHPSWHHSSIQERIDFLELAIQNPQLVAQHHQKVRKWVAVYLTVLILASIGLLFVLF